MTSPLVEPRALRRPGHEQCRSSDGSVLQSDPAVIVDEPRRLIV